MDIEITAKRLLNAAITVHRSLGPGLLESVYQKCLRYELTRMGLKVECEVPVPIRYGDIHIDGGYRLDMLVEDAIIIENITVESLLPIHKVQLLTYLKLADLRLGFLLNWNVPLLKMGIKRIVNKL